MKNRKIQVTFSKKAAQRGFELFILFFHLFCLSQIHFHLLIPFVQSVEKQRTVRQRHQIRFVKRCFLFNQQIQS